MGFKKLLLTFIVLLSVCYSFAQVTTSGVTGVIKDDKGQGLIGATVKAVHVPTGTVYGTTTQEGGRYAIPNMRVGGPYTITVTYVGYETSTYKDLYLSLGSPLTQNGKLSDQSKSLSEVTITGTRNGIISSQRNGTSTNISQRQLTELPTVSRSIQDFTRLTPQAVPTYSSTDGSPLGISFAGQSNKFNQFSVDGANANDVFGLSATGTNGGQTGANPVPLESIQEVQVVLSPYDVTQSGFTGGGVNAVTKSGTNTFHGSAYFLNQNEGFIGKNVLNQVKYPEYKNTTWGASLGGAIVKNKLFFFVNAERNDISTPLPYNPAEAGSGSKFNLARLDSIATYVKSLGYDPGSYTDINKKQYATSVFGRIDWNISDKHKLTIRHSYVDGSNYVISRTATTMTYGNSGYYMLSKANSSVIELNSNFSSTKSNVLRVTYNRIRDSRKTSEFPSVYLQENSLNYNIGSDFSSVRNSLNQDNFTIVDNFTLIKNKHTLTFGTDNQFYNTNNVFLQYYYGYYNYKSVPAFLNNNAAPATYGISYSTKGGDDNAPGKIHAAQFSVYGQDVWDVKENFKLTYGLRIDLPVFFNKPDENAAFNASAIATSNNVNNTQTPKTRLMFAPRVGFNWDVKGDGTTQLRGGVGLFTGRVPFVWISNAYSNTGIAFIKSSATPAATLRFNYDPTDIHKGAYIPASGAPTEIDVTAKNFKYPQVFRTNLAIDQKLPWWGLIGSVEALYSKTFNNINYRDLNVGPQAGNVALGKDNSRPWYNFQRKDATYTNVIYLDNTSKGYAYNLTVQIQKPLYKGWTGSLAYTYGESYSVNDGTSSTAYSNWRFAYNTGGLNSVSEATHANFDPGHRIIGYLSKTFKYAKGHLATTVGVVYSGFTGQRYSYLYNYNLTGDDVSGKTGSASLLYVPTDASQFANLTVNGTVVTPDQQFQDFKEFSANNKYLENHAGQNTERNGARMPWESHFDVKIAQDFYVYKTHKLQVSFDILNAANLLNHNWGWSYYLSNQSVPLFSVVSQTNTPTFTFDKTKMNNINGILRPYTVNDYLSRWRGQLSIRYSF
ncbi:TonB-dependent receptor plug domain-containing protein [Chitinophaga oryziterrae]|uniref:TonB-dependent receptor plug domain-containing protein n=1 Tax=Chitinophaga oryziterrae TaxID=1031224 RepID=A0A6N8J8D3_9BACT|nr:carboxypeptidase regulatory-like domain-containing protein [Chitinophaga oryziterrae]MVT41545.1 TonB-dependent receptor plug domain-containing protein [Chitinophaga oryziterrae]